jgi:dTDP-4-dehydrorhamnose reductase
MKILVLGSTGMLGSAVGKYLIEVFGKDVWTSYRIEHKEYSYGQNFLFDATLPKPFGQLKKLGRLDYIINCIGSIKPYTVTSKDYVNTIYLNSVFSRKLANYCADKHIKLIHITTDCVFSGKKGKYTELDLHDVTDIYGRSKSLGEPENCMVLRTSIIGHEVHGKVSLLEWIKSQEGKEVNGFSNHYWNGITCLQYGKCCEQIIRDGLYALGTYHIFSPNVVSKYQLLQIVNEKFNLHLQIKDVTAPESIDRTLSTTKLLCSQLTIPVLEMQIGVL